MTDFRALCEELLTDYEQNRFRVELAAEARAALAEQPVGPTDEEIMEMSDLISRTAPWLRHRHPDHARTVLAHWGQP